MHSAWIIRYYYESSKLGAWEKDSTNFSDLLILNLLQCRAAGGVFVMGKRLISEFDCIGLCASFG
jgi:hypothetical protein